MPVILVLVLVMIVVMVIVVGIITMRVDADVDLSVIASVASRRGRCRRREQEHRTDCRSLHAHNVSIHATTRWCCSAGVDDTDDMDEAERARPHASLRRSIAEAGQLIDGER